MNQSNVSLVGTAVKYGSRTGVVVHDWMDGYVNLKMDDTQMELASVPVLSLTLMLASTPGATKESLYRACTKALLKTGKTRKFLTADDVLKNLALEGKVGYGLSTLMTEAARQGVLRPTKRYKRSKRTGGPLKVWQSLVYEG